MSGGGRRFHLKERLGAGAFGEVYLAEMDSDGGFRRRVAVKLLGPDMAGRTEAGRRMRDEARILGRLNHKHIVTVLDLLLLGGQWAVVMDYVPGCDLERVLISLTVDDERFPVPAALEACAAVAEAIDAAYATEDDGGALRVLHRDLKPSNVILTKDADIKVLDFGVARVNLGTRESHTGARVGTERYMSPQRLVGDDDDLAGDVYAIGVTAIELILREEVDKAPIDAAAHRVWAAQWIKRLRAPLRGPPEAVEELVALIDAAIAFDSAGRPTARQLADALAQLSRRLEGETLSAFSRRYVPRATEQTSPPGAPIDWILTESGSSSAASAIIGPTRPVAATPPPARPGGSRILTVALLGLAAAAVAAVGIGATLRGPPRAATEPERPSAPVAVPHPAPETAMSIAQEPAPVAAPAVEPKPALPARSRPPTPPPTPGSVGSHAPVVDAPQVSRALVVVPGAASIRVQCGGVIGEGTATARVTSFPAGRCTISAGFGGAPVSTDIVVDAPREVHCALGDAGLTCS